MDPSAVPASWRDLQPTYDDPAPREGLEELYQKLEAAIAATADLVTVAQMVLPDDVSVTAFVALQELARLKQIVDPGPTEEDPF